MDELVLYLKLTGTVMVTAVTLVLFFSLPCGEGGGEKGLGGGGGVLFWSEQMQED